MDADAEQWAEKMKASGLVKELEDKHLAQKTEKGQEKVQDQDQKPQDHGNDDFEIVDTMTRRTMYSCKLYSFKTKVLPSHKPFF